MSGYHGTVRLNQPRGVANIKRVEASVNVESLLPAIHEKQEQRITNATPTDQELANEIDGKLKNCENIEQEMANLVKKFQNEFQFYYLIDRYSDKFTIRNLIICISSFRQVRENLPNEYLQPIPAKIQARIDDLFLKHGPYFSELNCSYFLSDLSKLKFTLDNYCIQVLFQLLKYHVNNLELDKLVTVKHLMNELVKGFDVKKFDDVKKKKFVNELVSNLELALKYAVMLKCKSDSSTIVISNMLVYFTQDFSQNQYDDLLRSLKANWKYMRPAGVVYLVESLAKREYKHIVMLNLICNYVCFNMQLLDSTEERSIGEHFSYKILMALKKLNFYNGPTVEILVENILKKIKNLEDTKDHIDAVNGLLSTCISLNVHPNKHLIDYFINTFILNKNGIVTGYENVNLNYHDFLYYLAVCNHKK